MDWWPLIFIPLTLLFVISISWTQSRGAPWVPTSLGEVDKMLAIAEVGPNDVVYDLGCGDGRTIVTAARRYGTRAVALKSIRFDIFGASCSSQSWCCVVGSRSFMAIFSKRI